MRLEFKTGEALEVDKVLSVIVNALFVRVGGDYYLINRHALVGKYAVEEVEEDE